VHEVNHSNKDVIKKEDAVKNEDDNKKKIITKR